MSTPGDYRTTVHPDTITPGWCWEGNSMHNITTGQRVRFDPSKEAFFSDTDGPFSMKAIPAGVLLDLLNRWSHTPFAQRDCCHLFQRLNTTRWGEDGSL